MATPHVITDTFICGSCQTYFNDLVTFLEHKRSTSCGVTVAYDAAVQDRNVTVLAEASNAAATEASKASPTKTGEEPVIKIIKKRGRPRKTDKKPEESGNKVTVKKKQVVKKSATQGADGSLTCDVCKLKFTRERHFNSHKCKLSDDLYLKPEDIPELEEGFDSRLRYPVSITADGEGYTPMTRTNLLSTDDLGVVSSDGDDTEDYIPPSSVVGNEEDEPTAEGEEEEQDMTEETDPSVKKSAVKRKYNVKRRSIVGSDARKKLASLSRNRVLATYAVPQTLDDIPDIPVFPSVEARQEFERKEITVVDLSLTENMYKIHVIEQTMNENALPLAPRSGVDITLYSCNTCEKVFKSVSHIRYHCLTHIDKKPFKCPQCDFRTNSKGNVYSHMRKHTGQMYKCGTCQFETVNKTHLLEHESTHSGVIHKCAICKKHYSTTKSLVNHIRGFHSKTEEGRSYLTQFVQTKEGPGAALLYECHVCDRKFKKQSDRDRHLYVHNVRVEQTLYKCQLCSYETNKQINLDAHYIKHKYIYSCIFCEELTLSVQNLMSHLSDKHSDKVSNDELPQECIEKSLYLPADRRTVLEAGQSASSDEAASADTEHLQMFCRLGYKNMTLDIFNDIRNENGVHECAECGLWFSSAEVYQKHVQSHTEERPFSCEYCEHKASSRNSLKIHMNAYHEDRQFTCNQCMFVSKSKIALVEHKSRHEVMTCPLCAEYTAGRKALRNHLLSKHDEVDAETARRLSGFGRRTDAMKSGQAFKCPYCDKVFTNNNLELKKHIWTHEGIKPFRCELCDYACRTKSNLQSHMLRHTEHKPFPCVYCGKRYKSKTALRWHERSHANGRLFKCDKCSYEGTQKSHLVRHMETHNILKRFSCNQCHFSANTLGYMRIHYTRFHPGLSYTHDSTTEYSGENGVIEASAPPTNVFKCVSCDYLFGNLSDMKRHLRMKHRIHIADMRGSTGQDVITQIVPMENQDGITSDVQIITLPPEGDHVGRDSVSHDDGQHTIIHSIPADSVPSVSLPTAASHDSNSISAVVDGTSSAMFIGEGEDIRSEDLSSAGIQLIQFANQDVDGTVSCADGTVHAIMMEYPSTSMTSYTPNSTEQCITQSGEVMGAFPQSNHSSSRVLVRNRENILSVCNGRGAQVSLLKTHYSTVSDQAVVEEAMPIVHEHIACEEILEEENTITEETAEEQVITTPIPVQEEEMVVDISTGETEA